MMKKISNRELEERVNRAVDNFMQGYGCCQSVLAAFCDLYGMDETLALKVAAGFGGGVGRLRMMCGAVSGLVMLVGLDCGQTEGSDREGKSACYKVVQDLLAQSQAENGSLICAEILGLKGHEKAQSSYVASPRTAEYYKTRPCAAKVESAARIFAKYLSEKYPEVEDINESFVLNHLLQLLEEGGAVAGRHLLETDTLANGFLDRAGLAEFHDAVLIVNNHLYFLLATLMTVQRQCITFGSQHGTDELWVEENVAVGEQEVLALSIGARHPQ